MAATESRTETTSVEEAGRRLGVSRNSAYEAARRGEIPVIKIGRRLLVPTAALDRLLHGGTEAIFDTTAA